MKPEVHEPLGHVAGVDALCRLTLSRQHELVHGRTGIGLHKDVVQLRAKVVAVQHGVLADLFESLTPHGSDVGIGANEHPEVAVEGAHFADGVGPVIVSQNVPIVAVTHGRHRKERPKVVVHAYRPGSRAAAAMGSGEGLVEIEMDHIKAHVARANNVPMMALRLAPS